MIRHSFNEESDGLWITYALQACNPETAVNYLEFIVKYPKTYSVLGGDFSAAASDLGKVHPIRTGPCSS